MDSVGVFREGEIDGKPFHIFSFLSQTSSSSSDLGGDHLSLESLQPRFICPTLRYKEDPNSDDRFVPYHYSPHFPITNINNDDDDDDKKFCKHPVFPIFWCNNKEPDYEEFNCYACVRSEHCTAYYMCPGCEEMFHKECVETPLEIQIPSFPFLSFQLYHSRSLVRCIKCKLLCNGMFYHCPTNKVSMHPLCAMKPIDILIDHPKRHPHILTFFPKQASLLCDVCGLVKEDSLPTYVCARCIFVVHRDCIDFPYVIKISRHPHHRISFNSSLPSGNWSCGVCRRKVDNRFGAYSCNKCSDYFVHSRCAVREDVWDGIELEGVPEESEEIVEPPFVKIADGIVLHFLHDHHLKLEVSKAYNEYTICQACVLPAYEGNFYSCLDGCNFVLHEKCASAPRKIHHALHAHPLILKPHSDVWYDGGYFLCSACRRRSCGFVYEAGMYTLDVRCASVPEPFEYQGHEHPLYLCLDPTQEEEEAKCRICRQKRVVRKLSCIECNYIICFRCATRPYKAKYKHDEHFLTFQEGKEGSEVFDWCEVCETKIEYSSADGFYACVHCCTSLHVRCLLGDDPYLMKPGQVIKYCRKEADIISNNTQSRPLCHNDDEDMHLCSQKVVFKWNEKTYCSYSCFWRG